MAKNMSKSTKHRASEKSKALHKKSFESKVKKNNLVKVKMKALKHKQWLKKHKRQEDYIERNSTKTNHSIQEETTVKGHDYEKNEYLNKHHRKHMKEKRDKNINQKRINLTKKREAKGPTQNHQLLCNEISQQVYKKKKWKKKPNKLHVKSRKNDESFANRGHQSSQVQQNSKPKRPDIWFDDVDMDLIEQAEGKVKPIVQAKEERNPLVQERSFDGLTKTVAMDCEMVGVGADGSDSILARVSIVNLYGKCIYDKYVRPTEKVTDYRTEVSGIRRADIVKGLDFKTVQQEVSDILKNRILVGHAIENDLKVLYLDHPHKMIRDTMRYRPFRALVKGRNPSLKRLASEILGVEVQLGEHNSVQDAQAAMRLYTMHKIKWEEELSRKFWKPNPMKQKKSKKAVDKNKYLVDLQDSD